MGMKKYKPFEICPVVCAAGKNYVICVPVSAPVLMSVFVGGTEFTNDSCGVKVSNCFVQKFTLPMALLDEAKEYTVVYEIVYREAYCSKKEPPVSRTFRFYPLLKTDGIRIYHLSDVHGRGAAAVSAGKYYGDETDLLILNGDISSSTQTVKESELPLHIAFRITKGERPCVITRGNHDLRGKYAERLGEFYPLDNGRFYYTVRLGGLWLLVLDCGEDKEDGHREYAGTVAFHRYREKETAFLQRVAENAGEEYESPGVKYKMVISHIPFMHTDFDPKRGVHEFDIEIDTYTQWVRTLNTDIRPDLGLFGHVHRNCVIRSPGQYNEKGFASPMILGGRPLDNNVEGTALTLYEGKADVAFTDKHQKARFAETLKIK